MMDAVYAAGLNRIYIIGNGGSYANAIHLCNDFLNAGFRTYVPDPATLTAFANDHGYENAFSKWLRVVGEKDDLLIALSGSGKSPNILKAVDEARDIGMSIYMLFGAALGQNMQDAEEYQIRLGHEVFLKFKK